MSQTTNQPIAGNQPAPHKVLTYTDIDRSLLKGIPNPTKEAYEIKINILQEDLMAVFEPKRLRIVMICNPRGGISSRLTIDSDWKAGGGQEVFNDWEPSKTCGKAIELLENAASELVEPDKGLLKQTRAC